MRRGNQVLAAASLAVAVGFGAPASAQQSAPHLEACVQKGWGFLDTLKFRFGTVNTCDKTVVNWFMAKDRDVVRHTVGPGEVFDTEISSRSVIDRGWIFATCPVGYAPDIKFSDDNWRALGDSRYSCVKN